MFTGLLVLFASALTGVLWDTVGHSAPFALGATGAVAAAAVLVFVRTGERPAPPVAG